MKHVRSLTFSVVYKSRYFGIRRYHYDIVCVHVEPTDEVSSKSIVLRGFVCVCLCAYTRTHACVLTCMAVIKILPYPYVTRLQILVNEVLIPG